MRYIQHKTDFKDIGTVVFYTRNGKFFPEEYLRNKDESDPTPLPQLVLTAETKDVYLDSGCDKVLYCVSDSKLVDIDFAEYDFSYITEKAKFNNNLKLNYISQETKELIGKDKEDLKKVESAIFPTLISEEESSEVSYFSSTRIQNQTLYLLNVPKDIIKVELYEGAIETNWSNVIGFSDLINDTGDFLWPVYPKFIDYDLFKVLSNGEDKDFITKPAITIYFGPSYYNGNNKDSSYYFPDNIQKNLTDSSKSWLKEMDEIECSKVVWLLLASDSSISEINLAYDSWINNINPHRNKMHYTLRNDDYYSTRESLSVLEKYNWDNEDGDSELVFDAASGTLLGTKRVDINSSIFLKKKLDEISNKYSPYINYSKGDIVNIGEEQFISLCDNNLNNYPKLSYMWMNNDNINIFTHSISVYSDPPNSAMISPSTITIKTSMVSGSLISFDVSEYPGYEFKNISNGSNIIDSTKSTNTEISGKYSKTISITNSSDLSEINSLYFNFESVGIPIRFKYTDLENFSAESIIDDVENTLVGDWTTGLSLEDLALVDIETSEDGDDWSDIENINRVEILDEETSDKEDVKFLVPVIDIKSKGVNYIFTGLKSNYVISDIYIIYYSLNKQKQKQKLSWELRDWEDSRSHIYVHDPNIKNYQSAELYISIKKIPILITVYQNPQVEFSFISTSIPYNSTLEELKFIISEGYKLAADNTSVIPKNRAIAIINDSNTVYNINESNIIAEQDYSEDSESLTIDTVTKVIVRRSDEGIYTITMKNVLQNYKIIVNTTIDNDN